jgi:subtilisin family serine protease
VRAGIVVVVSAGNYGIDRETGTEGYAGITSPGNAPSAITVGALDTLLTDSRDDDVVARYNSRGPTWYDAYAKLDLVAPGSALVASTSIDGSILLENPHLEVDTAWVEGLPHVRLSGTSMATAVTTGVVAHMVHAHAMATHNQGWLTPNAIKALLQYTALPMLGMDLLTQGAGGLNGDGAVRLAGSIDSAVDPGMWWLAVPGGESSAISGQDYMWSQRIIWGALWSGATTSTISRTRGTSRSFGVTVWSGVTA